MLYTPSTGDKSLVPLVNSAQSAQILIRAFGQAIQRREGLSGPQFVLQIGTLFGLYEDRGHKDLVYIPLQKVDEGVYRRTSAGGDDAAWEAIVTKLATQFRPDEHATMKQDIINVIEGKFTTNSEAILEAAGAMMADTKTSIEGFVILLNRFKASEETRPRALFAGANPIWAPAVQGGRTIPHQVKSSS